MGLTKDYLKFIQAGTCNLIGSPDGAVRCVDNLTCAVMAAESILFYNMRTLEKTYEIRCEANIVTAFEMSPDKTMIAIGYNNGEIHLHKTQQEDAKIVFMGHKTGVNSIAFSNDGFTLATGGKDSLIVLWDVLNESGICRFFGHKGSITHLKFAQNDRFLLSSSKDSTIRFWSIEGKSCFYTLAESSTEIYSFALINNDRLLIIGNAEIELVICELSWEGRMNTDDESRAKNPRIEKIYENDMDEQENNILRSTRIGTLMRQAKGRALQIIVSTDESIICCIGSDSLMDVFRHFTAEESKKRYNKKLRKMRQKMEIQDETALLKLEEEVNKDITTLITRIGDFRADSKIKSIDFCDSFNLDASENIREFRLYCLLRTNDVQGISLKIDWKSNSTESIKLASLGTRIHRTDVRTLSFSSDGTFFGSGSQESAIIWDAETLTPLNKFTADGLNLISASLITPDDKQFILGTKTGSVYLFNIQKCELIEKYERTHNGMINQFFLCPQNDGFISCGQDKICKFWKFEIKEEIRQWKKMNLKSKRLLELPDEALCASISPNNKFVAFGLLDNTARVYFMDTLKFFVSLYGHSLAIYSIDISLDSKLIITGSADKSVKIWGLDFGDCHKSIFAHDDTVNCVKFSTNKDDENLFWSAGKDGKIKQWDAIKFNHIQTLQGHNDQIDSLILNSDGKILISASRDKSIRIWELSEEIIVLQEEDEKLREKDYEEKLVEEEDILPGEEKEPTGDLAPLKSIETIKSTESIIETIEIIKNERNEKANPMHKRHVLLNSYASNSEHLFLLDTISKIRSSHLEKSLLGLPFGYIPDLLEGMCECIQNSYRPETASKVINFILRIHHNEIIHSLELLSIVHNLKKELPTQLNSFLTRTGFNIAALKLMQMEIEKQQNTKIFDLNVVKEKKRKKKKFKRSN